MRVQTAAASLLVIFVLPGIRASSNITLLRLPINLTSWRITLDETFNRSLMHRLAARLTSAINDTLSLIGNATVDCTPEGEECIPEIPSCCPYARGGLNGSVEEEDLQCLPDGDVHRCTLVKDSVDLAQLRLNALEHGDSAGILESHPWINSWEFQSKSEAEREELQDLQDDEWKKHWKPSNRENFWLKTYKKVKNGAVNIWKDLRKMKKLKEVKDNLIDKKNKRLEPTIPPLVETKNPATPETTGVTYPDELSEATASKEDQTKTDSEESVIKFSDELPKREKVDFRLDDIIKDAVKLLSENFKKKNEVNNPTSKEIPPPIPSQVSEEELLRLDKIQDTVDKLMEEINELKKIKTQKEDDVENNAGGVLNIEHKVVGSETEELIKKEVRNVLEEERRLKN